MSLDIHHLLEIAFLTVLTLWTLGSAIYALPLPPIRRWLNRHNHGLWWAKWTVFGSGVEQSEIGVYPVEFRDRIGAAAGDWREAVRGRPWTWHAGLWQPKRRLADRLHRIGQDIAKVRERGAPPADWLARRRRLVTTHLATVHLPAPGAIREIRIRMIRSVVEPGTGEWGAARREERVLDQWTAGRDEHGH